MILGSILLATGASLWLFPRFRSFLEQQFERFLFPTRRAARDAIRRVSADLVKLPHAEDLPQQFITTLMDGFGLTGIALYRKLAKRDAFKLACTNGRIAGPETVDQQALTEEIGDDGAVVFVPDRDSDDARPPSLAQSLRWEAFVPVRLNGSWLGLIALGPKASGAAIDDTDVTLLAMVAAQLAVALKNIEYVRQIEQQKSAIEELQKRVEAENVSLRAEVRSASQFTEIIGSSIALQRVLHVVERVAPSNASILITGETGTGKELIARAIHDISPRKQGPLICINCPAIPAELAESELFGNERGAFTDAKEARPGKFELADGGTIFLDEVADLPLHVQVKLLRVLQERETQRIGGRKVHKLDLRVIAATNRDLHAAMRSQRFREDLYYRLAAVRVDVPPLRERIDDVPMLAGFFLERAATTYQKEIRGFTHEAVAALCRYNWPGNIRELQNVVERAVLLCSTDLIQPEHLSELALAQPLRPFAMTVRDDKRRRIEDALAQTGGNRAAAARLLGISPSNLARLMKNLGTKLPPSVQ